jgi:hypothetical protein
MTKQGSFDRQLRDWLEAEARAAVPGSALEAALDAVGSRRPRARWLAGLGSNWVGTPRIGPAALRGWPLPGELPGSARLVLGLLLVLAFIWSINWVGARLFTAPRPGIGQLAYSRDGQIYLAEWTGAEPIQLTSSSDGPAFGYPRFSPDGRYLLYEEDRPGPLDDDAVMHVVDASGARVATFPGFWASWSPDSAHIATHDVQGISVYSARGALERSLAYPEGREENGDQFLGWTRDSRQVLVNLRLPQAMWSIPIDGSPPSEVWSTGPIDTIGVQQLLPDGTRLRVARGEFSLVDPGSGAGRTVATRTPGRLEWLPWGAGDPVSPTGTQFAYSWTWQPATGDEPMYDLSVLDLTTGRSTVLVDPGPISRGPLRWSPDGAQLLFVQPGHGEAASSIWRVGADGSDPVLVVAGASDADWQWLSEPR